MFFASLYFAIRHRFFRNLPYVTIMTLSERLRQEDYDRYLISRRLPEAAQEGCWAVLAFNQELAKIAPTVSEAMLGLIRLQWWREAICDMRDGKTPRSHDVCQALAGAMRRYSLPADTLLAMIAAREQDLSPDPLADIPALLRYLDDTAGAVVQLQAQCVSRVPLAESAIKACRITGQRFGLIGLLRALPWHAAQGLCFMPLSMLKAHNLSRDMLLSARHATEVSALVLSLLATLPPSVRHPPISSYYEILTRYYEKLLVQHRGDVKLRLLGRPGLMPMLRLWLSRGT